MFDNKQFILAIKDTIKDFFSDDSISDDEKTDLLIILLNLVSEEVSKWLLVISLPVAVIVWTVVVIQPVAAVTTVANEVI